MTGWWNEPWPASVGQVPSTFVCSPCSWAGQEVSHPGVCPKCGSSYVDENEPFADDDDWSEE